MSGVSEQGKRGKWQGKLAGLIGNVWPVKTKSNGADSECMASEIKSNGADRKCMASEIKSNRAEKAIGADV